MKAVIAPGRKYKCIEKHVALKVTASWICSAEVVSKLRCPRGHGTVTSGGML